MLYIIAVQLWVFYGSHRMLHHDKGLYKYHSQFHLHPLNGISAFAAHPFDFAMSRLAPVLAGHLWCLKRLALGLHSYFLTRPNMCIDHNMDEMKSAYYRTHHETENCNYGHPRIDYQFKTHESRVNVSQEEHEEREAPPVDPKMRKWWMSFGK